MKLSEFFQQKETVESTHDWVLVSHDPNVTAIDKLAEFLADKIMRLHYIGAPHLYEGWKQKLNGTVILSSDQQQALPVFLKRVFGLPGSEVIKDHLEGYIAQYFWYFLVQDLSAEPIKRIERVGFKVTDHGGDGFVVHQIADEYLMFRLWEIKKSLGKTGINPTVSKAYNQLQSNAGEYLAMLTSINQEIKDDDELAEFYSKLVELWLQSSKQASVGIAISTKPSHIPRECFANFGEKFPKLTDPKRLKGMVTAIDDFSEFCQKVKEVVWKGL